MAKGISRKSWLLALAFVAGFGAICGEAAAQAASNEIIVTGTRILRQNFEAPTAVLSIGGETLTRTGAVEVGDALRRLPQIGASQYTPTNAAALATTGFGLSTVQLRNLSEDRTLVLINGRRMVAGNPGTQNVDFNTIPTEMIDRIDVVTGGASAIYGSDALAGVINIITKKDFGGLQLSGRYGETEQMDNTNFKLSATGGTAFAADRGHATVGFSWSKEDGAYARDHGGGVNAQDFVNTMINDTGDPKDIKNSTGPVFSSYSLAGNFRIPSYVTGSDTGLVVGPGGAARAFSSTVDGFNRNARRRIASPIERYSLNSQVDYKVNDLANWFLEGSYNSTKAQTGGEPFPLDSHNIYGDGSANFDAQCGVLDDVGRPGVNFCQYGIPGTNPIIPASILAAVRAANPGVPDSDLVVGFRRRTAELGNRDGAALRQTFRVATGFEGDISPDLRYNASVTYGRTTSHEESTGQINTLNARAALDAIVLNGQIVCRDVIARAQGCVPLNLFGVNSITPAMAAYVTAGNARDAQIDEFVGNIYLAGNIIQFELPGGKPQWVLGGEYRKEKSSDVPDSLTQLGLNASNVTPPTFGEFDVSEYFGELRLPLLKDVSFAKALDLNFAARYSNYSTVGSTRSYSASIEYEPVDWLKTRVQYARAVRAPNISELYQPGLQDFPSVSDPCGGVTRSGGAAAFFNTRTDLAAPANVLASGVDASTIGDPVAVACLTDPAVAARVARDGGLAISQAEAQGTQGFDSGNPNLKAEEADTYSAGFVFRPTFIDWLSPLSLSVDYYNIKISGAIDTLDEQTELNKCYVPGLPAQFCGTAAAPLITRISAGPFLGALLNVNQVPLNTADLKAEGIDVQASYRWDFGGRGMLTTGLVYSYLLNRETTPYDGATPIDYTGTIGSPRHRATTTVDYSIGKFAVSWQTEIIGAAKFDNDPASPVFGAKQKTTLFHDAQFRYAVNENTVFEVGVDNVFNEYVHIGGNIGEVPVPVTGLSSVGIDTLPELFDALGRRFYIGLKAKF